MQPDVSSRHAAVQGDAHAFGGLTNLQIYHVFYLKTILFHSTLFHPLGFRFLVQTGIDNICCFVRRINAKLTNLSLLSFIVRKRHKWNKVE